MQSDSGHGHRFAAYQEECVRAGGHVDSTPDLHFIRAGIRRPQLPAGYIAITGELQRLIDERVAKPIDPMSLHSCVVADA